MDGGSIVCFVRIANATFVLIHMSHFDMFHNYYSIVLFAVDIKTIEEPRPEPSCEHHIHTKIQKTTVKETTETRVTCTTPKCVKGCRCQL